MEPDTYFTSIGWIGTGVMGVQQARHLIEKGYKLSVYNRTESKADSLLKIGASFKSPQEIAKTCQLVILMLGYPHDVEEMLLGSENGILKHMQKGAYLIDHTTSKPGLAIKIAEEASKLGVHSIDAPVSGGEIGAINGTLVAMCGGNEQSFQEIRPILSVYCKAANLLGEAGAGQHTKCVNQINIAGCMIGVCEGLIYAKKAGLNITQVLETIGGGAAGSFSLNVYGPKIIAKDMKPGFYVEHFVKDMEIVLDECRRMGIALPGLALVHQLYRGVIAQGGARLGVQSLIQALEGLNNFSI